MYRISEKLWDTGGGGESVPSSSREKMRRREYTANHHGGDVYEAGKKGWKTSVSEFFWYLVN